MLLGLSAPLSFIDDASPQPPDQSERMGGLPTGSRCRAESQGVVSTPRARPTTTGRLRSTMRASTMVIRAARDACLSAYDGRRGNNHAVDRVLGYNPRRKACR